MADQWVRLDCSWYRNPKFLMLADDRKWHSIAVYFAALGYSGEQGIDGFIPFYALAVLGGTQRESADLVAVNLWHDCDGGWQINDWAAFQRTSEETQKRSKQAREAALFRWHGRNGKR